MEAPAPVLMSAEQIAAMRSDRLVSLANALDWVAVEEALTSQAATGARSTILAHASRVDPKRYRELSANVMVPVRTEREGRRRHMIAAGKARADAQQAAAVKATARRELKFKQLVAEEVAKSLEAALDWTWNRNLLIF